MAITQDRFRASYNPDSGEIQFLTSGNTINAAIISTEDCQGKNSGDVLRNMTKAIFIIDGQSYPADIVEVLNRGSHFYFEVDPFAVSSTGSISNCAVSLYAYDVGSVSFSNGDFNPLIGNATIQESIGYVYDVDRKRSQISPANIQGILSDSAQPANIQLSNYSITGLVNSKYVGAKTSIEEYGTVPLISGRIFQGANYTLGTETTLICSLLYNSTFEEGNADSDFFIQRTINQNTVEEFLFAPNPKLTVTPTNNIPQIRRQRLAVSTTSFNDTDTLISLNISDSIQVGDILELETTGNIEYIKVLKSEYDDSSNTQSIGCIRGYRSEIEGGFPAISHSNPLVTRIAGDIIYKLERNTFYKLSESLIAVADNEKVYYIDEDGSLFLEVKDCTPDI